MHGCIEQTNITQTHTLRLYCSVVCSAMLWLLQCRLIHVTRYRSVVFDIDSYTLHHTYLECRLIYDTNMSFSPYKLAAIHQIASKKSNSYREIAKSKKKNRGKQFH